MIKRPVLRYFGGKWRIAPWIISHLPPHTCYVEPFGGGASILLRKRQSPIEVYNDADGEVVNFFRMLRERTDELVKAIALTPYSRAELDLTYEPCDDPLERARRMFVRSWQGRGGARNQWRTGWRYQRTDNQRKRVVGDWNETDRLSAVACRLKSVLVEHGSWQEILRRYDTPDTLFYCDPPYLPDVRGERWAKSAYAHEMTEDDHRELAIALNGLKGMVVISGYPSPVYEELYAGWTSYTRMTLRDGRSNGNAKATEVLWLSPAARARARQQPLEEAIA